MEDVEDGGAATDEFTDTSHQNYFQRLGNALCGLFVGFALFAAAGPALWWNEGRAVMTAKAIKAGMKHVVEVPCGPANQSLDGKLVHAACHIDGLANITFVDGAVHADNVVFARVEPWMWQWREHKHSKSTDDRVGGGKSTTTTYTYSREWVARPIDSADFYRPGGHTNPPASAWPVTAETRYAPDARVGPYSLSQALMERFRSETPIDLPRWNQTPAFVPGKDQPPAAITTRNTARGGDNYLLTFDPSSSPTIGAMRIRFYASTAREASVIAQQAGTSLTPWKSPSVRRRGYEINELREGILSAHDIFELMLDENRILTWILRSVFFVLAWVGLMLMTNIASTIPDIIPLVGPALGDLVGCVLATAMFFVAFAYCTLVIAAAWLRFRPLLSVVLLAVAFAGVAAFSHVRQRAQQEARKALMA